MMNEQTLKPRLDVMTQEDNKPVTTLPSLWAEMGPDEETAVDQIMEYLIKTGARPQVKAKGDIVEIVTAITNAMQQSIPPHLSDQLKIMVNYIGRFLCDYVENYRVTSLNINFGFGAKPIHSEEAL